MKKLMILGIAVFFAFSMNAQRFGVRLGGNFAGMMSTIESKGTKIAPGLQAGIVTEIGPKRINLHLEANFAQKGFNVDLTEDLGGISSTVKSAVNFNYIEVPALLKVKIVGPLYVYAGPYFGFSFSGNQLLKEFSLDGVELTDTELDALGIVKDQDLFETDLYNKTDWGAAGGLGVQFGIGPIRLFAEGRATIGLANLYDTESDAYQALVADGGWKDNEHLKNMVYTVAVGILLGK